MNSILKSNGQTLAPEHPDFAEHLWEKSWTYIKTVVDVVREPVLVLDKDLRVMIANDPFYRTFQVDAKATEGTLVYKLGNNQWDIPTLRKLLEDILPKNSFFKGFEVSHDFPVIGRKVMILNARQIHFKDDAVSEKLPPIILLAMEDITDMIVVAETLANHAKILETKLGDQIQKLEREISELKRKSL